MRRRLRSTREGVHGDGGHVVVVLMHFGQR